MDGGTSRKLEKLADRNDIGIVQEAALFNRANFASNASTVGLRVSDTAPADGADAGRHLLDGWRSSLLGGKPGTSRLSRMLSSSHVSRKPAFAPRPLKLLGILQALTAGRDGCGAQPGVTKLSSCAGRGCSCAQRGTSGPVCRPLLRAGADDARLNLLLDAMRPPYKPNIRGVSSIDRP